MASCIFSFQLYGNHLTTLACRKSSFNLANYWDRLDSYTFDEALENYSSKSVASADDNAGCVDNYGHWE